MTTKKKNQKQILKDKVDLFVEFNDRLKELQVEGNKLIAEINHLRSAIMTIIELNDWTPEEANEITGRENFFVDDPSQNGQD